MKHSGYQRYRLLLALAIALVGVGGIMHYAQRPHQEEITYQNRVQMPESHHSYAGALKAGQKAVLFSLENHNGNIFDLERQLESGPIVLTFFRGNWCPLCAAHLKKLEGIKDQVHDLGGQLVAVSAQTPAKTAKTQQKFAVTFPVLSDKNMQVTKAYGVDWKIPEEDREGFAAWLDKSTGQSLNEYQKVTDEFTLPVPATYVIAATGDIAYAHVDKNYKNRAQPDKILAALKALR